MLKAKLGEHTSRLATIEDYNTMYELLEPYVVKRIGHSTAIARQERVLQKKLRYYTELSTAVVVEKDGVITGASLSDGNFVVHFVSVDKESMHSVMLLLYTTLVMVHGKDKESKFKVVDQVGRSAFDIYVVSIDEEGNGVIPLEAKEVLVKRFKRLGGE
jgi:hypothetical protein